MPQDAAEEKMIEFVTEVLGAGYSYEAEYQGTDSYENYQLYVWTVYPVIEGFRLDQGLELEVYAHTGTIHRLYPGFGEISYYLKPEAELHQLTDAEEGLRKIQELTDDNIVYSETVFIKSTLTGELQPAHMYKVFGRQYYINAVLGIPDQPM